MFPFTARHVRLMFVLLVMLLVIRCGRCYKYKPKQARCERIVIPLCSDIPYNYTRMPNLLGHVTQQEAAAQVHEFIPLVQIGCSRLLKFFLCAEYAPMCTEQVDETLVIPPCRSMCLEVRSRCEPILQRFNFHWPTSLDCDALPERSDRIDLCIEPPGEDDRFPASDGDEQANSPHHMFRSQPAATADNNNGDETGVKSDWIRLVDGLNADGSVLVRGGTGDGGRLPGPMSPGDNARMDSRSSCSDRYVSMATVEKAQSNKQSPSDVTAEICFPRCQHDVMFRADDKRFTNTWLITWSSISFLSSFITVLTFIIDRSRFRYPERPVVYICVCSAMHAGAYLIRFAVGRNTLSCDRTATHLVVHGDVSNAWCVVVAVMLYYFSIAGAFWWTILTISWYLAAARKWGEEAIETLAKYFHMVSWFLPAVCTAIAVVLQKIDADELTGLCYIGSSSATAINSPEGVASSSSIAVPLCFVVLPLVGCLAIGTGFVGAGFGAVRRVRRALQLRQRREVGTGVLGTVGMSGVDRLERLMVKMAVYSTLYAVPIGAVIGCLIYEIHGSAAWQHVARKTPCRPSTSADGLVLTVDGCRLDESIPAVEVYLVKTFASLMPGIGGGVWIWSMKTARSWRNFCTRCVVSTGGRRNGGKQVLPTGDVRTTGANGRMVRWPGGLVTTPPSSPGAQLFTLN